MRSEMKKTLEDLCLESILNNFKRLITVYNSASCRVPRKCFEFLQRTHSSTLLRKLSKSDCLEDDLLAFLINPHLKHLDLSSNSTLNVDIVISNLKIMGEHITMLDIREKYFNENVILELITLVPNVEALYLAQTESTDKVLKCIAKYCPLVETLDIGFCNITTEGLKSLCEKDCNGEMKQNKVLKKLHITATSINEDGVSFALSHFPSLEELDHDHVGAAIFNEHRGKFLNGTLDSAQKYNLKKLTIQTFHPSFHLGVGFIDDSRDKPAVKDVLKVCAVVCPHVYSLSVHNMITQADSLICADFPQLKEVKFCSSTNDLIEYTPFLEASGHSLTKIDFESGIVSLEVLGRCCPKLGKLILQSVNFEKPSESALKSKSALFPGVKILILDSMDLVHDSADAVSFLIDSSPNLDSLHLQHCRYLNENFVTTILNSKCIGSIRKIDFSYSDASFSAVKQVVAVAQFLEKLTIEDCDISDDDYQELLAILKSENRTVDVLWKSGSTDYESDYENDYDFFLHEYPFPEYELDYGNDYSDEDELDYDGYDIDDIDFYGVNDFIEN